MYRKIDIKKALERLSYQHNKNDVPADNIISQINNVSYKQDKKTRRKKEAR